VEDLKADYKVDKGQTTTRKVTQQRSVTKRRSRVPFGCFFMNKQAFTGSAGAPKAAGVHLPHLDLHWLVVLFPFSAAL
jgi:hypothetical protein